MSRIDKFRQILEIRMNEAKLKLKAGYIDYEKYALLAQEIKAIKDQLEEGKNE